ncbi:hypothetical protein E2C01_070659 [Portunus trituberculatus]|uniref:Uncharacterized protein n=1 Tax=Portunus trituberculatus TaxID=210409 RepID=A0A5B7HXW0_PORTR|nr:hypothetical protein [Portunus trituberculatus]
MCLKVRQDKGSTAKHMRECCYKGSIGTMCVTCTSLTTLCSFLAHCSEDAYKLSTIIIIIIIIKAGKK